MLKRILDIVVYGILVGLGYLTALFSIKQRMLCGRLIGRVLILLFLKRFAVARDNINKAMPELDSVSNKKIAVRSFENLGITLLEILMLQRIKKEDLFKLVKIPNPELIYRHLEKGKGVILLSAHYGNWEIMALATSVILDKKILIIVEQQTNSFITDKMYELRTKFGNETVGRYSAARSIITSLQKGGILGILGDQSAAVNKDIFVDFFGMPSLTYEAPAALALKYGSALLFTLSKRQKDGTYILEFIEINHDGLSDTKEDIRLLTERHVKILEHEIRENPGDWAWMHKRWKHKPKD